MEVFGCAACGTELTGAVTHLALPDHAHSHLGCGAGLLPPLLPPGTYAVDAEPSWPRRRWDELAPGEAETLGAFAAVPTLNVGARGSLHLAPGVLRGVITVPGADDGYCQGLDGRDGPNLLCAACEAPVGFRRDDCGFWQEDVALPGALRRLRSEPVTAAAEPDLAEPPMNMEGGWSPIWEAAFGAALAHLLAMSGGTRLVVADPRLTTYLADSLAAFSPADGPIADVVLAGPSLPTTATGLALAPVDPRTGRVWGDGHAPLAGAVWKQVSEPNTRKQPPRVEGWHEPEPDLPTRRFTPDRDVFLHVLARLPQVREPWLLTVHEEVSRRWSLL